MLEQIPVIESSRMRALNDNEMINERMIREMIYNYTFNYNLWTTFEVNRYIRKLINEWEQWF